MLDAYPVLVPLISIEDDSAFMGRTPLDSFREPEIRFSAACNGSLSYGDLLESYPECEMLVDSLPYLVWWDGPLTGDSGTTASSTGTSLVISPHPDDAEISMGGWLLNRRKQEAVSHVVCFSQSEHCRYPEAFPTPCEVSAVRADEVNLGAKLLGNSVTMLGFPESSLRNALDPDEEPPALDKILKPILVEEITRAAPGHIFAPAAVGNHPDHRLIFDVVLELFEENRFPGIKFHFYEDLPYAASHLEIDDFLARFENAYLSVSPWFEDINGVFHLKQMLAEVFRSQFSPAVGEMVKKIACRNAFLAPGKKTADKIAKEIAAAERFWTLTACDFSLR